MKMLQWLKQQFYLHSVGKKTLLISKITAIIMIVFYIIMSKFPSDSTGSLILVIVFVSGLAILIDIILREITTKPIIHINDVANKMANLDFSESCNIKSNDEFKTLSNNLNKMASNLQEALTKLENANIQLEKDVQREHTLLLQRKELVDNLSHEMKTPLGIIRAYAEGIDDETDVNKKDTYAKIIIEESNKITDLINTLLDLSALEFGAIKLQPESFDFVELVETVSGRLLIDSPDVNFKLSYELPDTKLFVYTDKIRMQQVLNNLILNSKKYVTSGGDIKLSLTQEHNLVKFNIYNQTSNIQEEDLSKIWTKFYRRNESRNNNGSGLGLSIVGQILSMQDLEYGVKKIDKGIEFYFFIPLYK